MWNFVKSSSNKENWLNSNREICFIGRSNVGKSSLINAIANNKNLARVSNTPGRTQLINFFEEDKKIIVDLPGYGYAKVNILKKQIISQMVSQYFLERNVIERVFLLIDSKLGPTIIDEQMIGFIKSIPLKLTIVLTKIDKITQKNLSESIKKVENIHNDFIVVSSFKGTNINNLRKYIDSIFK